MSDYFCEPIDYSTPGLPVHHQLPELTQIHVHRVEPIQSSHSLLSPSPPAFNPYQHQNLFQWVNSLHQSVPWVNSLQSVRVSVSASVLTMNIQDWFPLGLTGLLSWQSKGHSSSPKPQLKSIISLAISFFYSSTVTTIQDYWKNHNFD